MKTLGLIGGISWHSTKIYYNTLNQLMYERLGGSNSAKLILYSVNFNDFKQLQGKNDWKQIEIMLSEIAVKLENAGADCIMICSNTPHMVADKIVRKIKVPFIHIAEETAKEISKQKITKVGLLGTKFTMENSFFTDRLSAYGIETVIPESDDREIIHSSIINELSKGIITKESKNNYINICKKLQAGKAQAIISGCTEIPLLIGQSDCEVPLFDTTEIHSKAAIDFAILSE